MTPVTIENNIEYPSQEELMNHIVHPKQEKMKSEYVCVCINTYQVPGTYEVRTTRMTPESIYRRIATNRGIADDAYAQKLNNSVSMASLINSKFANVSSKSDKK